MTGFSVDGRDWSFLIFDPPDSLYPVSPFVVIPLHSPFNVFDRKFGNCSLLDEFNHLIEAILVVCLV